MPRRKRDPLPESDIRCSGTPLTQEARETQLTSLAMDLAERRLREGTASAQEICYWLRRGTRRDQLEEDQMAYKNELLQAKTSQIRQVEETAKLYADAIKAFKIYGGEGDDEDYEEYDEDE